MICKRSTIMLHLETYRRDKNLEEQWWFDKMWLNSCVYRYSHGISGLISQTLNISLVVVVLSSTMTRAQKAKYFPQHFEAWCWRSQRIGLSLRWHGTQSTTLAYHGAPPFLDHTLNAFQHPYSERTSYLFHHFDSVILTNPPFLAAFLTYSARPSIILRLSTILCELILEAMDAVLRGNGIVRPIFILMSWIKWKGTKKQSMNRQNSQTSGTGREK